MNVERQESHLVVAPAGGIPPVVDSPAAFERALSQLDEASGPVAVDTERASGFRYHQNAYLVQLRRGDDPAVLLDPIAFDGAALIELQSVIGPTEWILHAASQDLPSLHELGLSPEALFDTELAARLLNLPHVGLGGLLEDLLGIHLKKEHSAADWSRRPLPEDWLAYAALDVEYLSVLRDEVAQLLEEQHKSGFAQEEFVAQLGFTPAGPGPEPWRRTSGITTVRTPAQLRVLRELWRERDRLAQARDLSPHRLIPDRAIVAAATHDVRNAHELIRLDDFQGRAASSELKHWWAAVQRGRVSNEPISRRAPSTGIPNHRSWPSRHPEAHTRLQAARAAVIDLAEQFDIPQENLLNPRILREFVWNATPDVDAAIVRERLQRLGARDWQTRIVAESIAEAISGSGLLTGEDLVPDDAAESF